MKSRIFGFLAFFLALACLELGSFLILSFSAGEVTGYTALRRLQQSRRGVEQLAGVEDQREWDEHRIAQPPALHPFIGYVANPIGHPRAEDPRFSRQSLDYGFPLNKVDLFRPVDDGEVVVGVFGGSFAANLAAGGTRLATGLQRHAARFGDKKLTVLTFAVAGHKQPQQLMALNYLLTLGVHLDVVINLDGFNEIALPAVTNIPKQYFPFYPRGWLLMVDDLDQGLRRRTGELTYLKNRRAERAALFSQAPFRFSLTAGLTWKVLDGALTGRISRIEMALLEEERGPSGNYQARGPRREYTSEEAMFEDLVAVWKRTSSLMDGTCRSRGIEYYHFLQPNQYVPGSKPLSAKERRIAWDEQHPYKPAVEKAYPRLAAAGQELRQEGVAFFDLTRIFADNEDTLYKDTCCHVNGQGNNLITRAIAAAVDAGARSPEP